MTKQEAIENHRKMWNWIADETLRQGRIVAKPEYFEAMRYDSEDIPSNKCFCCGYNEEYCDIRYHKTNFKCIYRACINHCPIQFIKEKLKEDELHDVPCQIEGSPYYKIFKYFQGKDISVKEYAEYARQIANLPEKE